MKKIVFILTLCFSMVASAFMLVPITSARYCADTRGAVVSYTVPQSFTYATKDDSEITVQYGSPAYSDGTLKQNICSVLAGSNIVGYYDQTFPELIADFTPLRTVLGHYIWLNGGEPVQNTINNLYSGMETNVGGMGTTIDGFKSGLSSYCSTRGRSAVFSEKMSSSLNWAACESSIRNNIPLACFIVSFNMFETASFRQEANKDSYNLTYYSGSHTSVVFGLRKIRYYNSNGNLIQEHKYLKVSTGFGTMSYGYVRVESSLQIDSVLSVSIT